MVDLSFLEKFTKGDSKKMKRYISLYLDMAPGTFDTMEKNLVNNDWEQLRINAHSFKPQAEFMGAISLKEKLDVIEYSIKNNHLSEIEEIVRSARLINDHYINLLEEYLSNSK